MRLLTGTRSHPVVGVLYPLEHSTVALDIDFGMSRADR
jgi:hypothetical protein